MGSLIAALCKRWMALAGHKPDYGAAILARARQLVVRQGVLLDYVPQIFRKPVRHAIFGIHPVDRLLALQI